MRIYISGAISSDSNFREKFQEAARKLYVAGHTPISPTDLPPGLTEGEYLQLDHLLIGFADAVFMLDDWTKSKGAMIEYELAIHMNKPVYFQGSAKNEQALGLRAYKPGGAWVYEEGYLKE